MTIVTMAGSIKLFLNLRNVYETMGIHPSHNDQHSGFNAKNLFFISCLTLTLLSVIAYSCIQAKSIEEYGMDFYAAITLLIAVINISLQVWNGPKIFELIEHSERFIKMSRFFNIVELIYWYFIESKCEKRIY